MTIFPEVFTLGLGVFARVPILVILRSSTSSSETRSRSVRPMQCGRVLEESSYPLIPAVLQCGEGVPMPTATLHYHNMPKDTPCPLLECSSIPMDSHCPLPLTVPRCIK